MGLMAHATIKIRLTLANIAVLSLKNVVYPNRRIDWQKYALAKSARHKRIRHCYVCKSRRIQSERADNDCDSHSRHNIADGLHAVFIHSVTSITSQENSSPDFIPCDFKI